MSLNIFLTLCILGIDFMIYAFFQWTYGDKRRVIAKKLAMLRKDSSQQASRPFVVASQASQIATIRRLQTAYGPVKRTQAISVNGRISTSGRALLVYGK